jgi:hypothetical protein
MVGVARLAPGASSLPEDLDQQIWERGLAKADVHVGFQDKTMSSHVHLAACKSNEVALEDSVTKNVVRGAFTHCLVNLLDQTTDLTQISYSALVDQLPQWEHQHPQCSGKYRHRALFGGVVNHPTLFELSSCGGKYSTNAGEIQGVVQGTKFAIHTFSNITSIEIGILEADFVLPHSCSLRRPDFYIPPGAKALMLNRRQGANILKVVVVPTGDEVQSMEGVFSLADACDNPDLIVHRISDNKLQFERMDLLMSKYISVLDNISADLVLSDVLEGVSHFNFHLSRCNIENPLKQAVNVVLRRLTQINPEEILEEAIFVPADAGMPLAPDRENIVFISNEATAFNDNHVYYGLTLKNNTSRPLFPYLLNFDPSDYSIQVRSLCLHGVTTCNADHIPQSWYHPPAKTMVAPLPARRKDGSGPSELPVCYGEAGVSAFEFELADGQTSDITFLKLFVSNVYVDMTVLEQSSPFFTGRGGKVVATSSKDVWDTWTYVLKTERQAIGNSA